MRTDVEREQDEADAFRKAVNEWAGTIVVVAGAVSAMVAAVVWMWATATTPMTRAIEDLRVGLMAETRARIAADSSLSRDRFDLYDLLDTPQAERARKLREIRMQWNR